MLLLPMLACHLGLFPRLPSAVNSLDLCGGRLFGLLALTSAMFVLLLMLNIVIVVFFLLQRLRSLFLLLRLLLSLFSLLSVWALFTVLVSSNPCVLRQHMVNAVRLVLLLPALPQSVPKSESPIGLAEFLLHVAAGMLHDAIRFRLQWQE